jgi:hypothetical protein
VNKKSNENPLGSGLQGYPDPVLPEKFKNL